jgi:hypothetical protein
MSSSTYYTASSSHQSALRPMRAVFLVIKQPIKIHNVYSVQRMTNQIQDRLCVGYTYTSYNIELIPTVSTSPMAVSKLLAMHTTNFYTPYISYGTHNQSQHSLTLAMAHTTNHNTPYISIKGHTTYPNTPYISYGTYNQSQHSLHKLCHIQPIPTLLTLTVAHTTNPNTPYINCGTYNQSQHSLH